MTLQSTIHLNTCFLELIMKIIILEIRFMKLFIVTPIVGVLRVLCFVVRYFMSILVLQSS